MLWLYVLIGSIILIVLLLLSQPLAKGKTAIVEVPTLMQALPQIPTEIKVSLPEIQFPDITIPEIPAFPDITIPEIPAFPELPDFEEIINNIIDVLPSTEDIKETIIDPVIDIIPTVEELEDVIPDWVKDPSLLIPKYVKDPVGYIQEKADEIATSIEEKVIDIVETIKPLPETIEDIVPTEIVSPTNIPIVNILKDPLHGLGQGIEQNLTKPANDLVNTIGSFIFGTAKTATVVTGGALNRPINIIRGEGPDPRRPFGR